MESASPARRADVRTAARGTDRPILFGLRHTAKTRSHVDATVA
jgi:hypothetical protein